MGAVLKCLRTVVVLMSYTQKIPEDNKMASLMHWRVFVTLFTSNWLKFLPRVIYGVNHILVFTYC